ncbi:predicted protein [Postia placenta Mad-698-R]|nr:predicted protein [Postia placenta Mad-698-R]
MSSREHLGEGEVRAGGSRPDMARTPSFVQFTPKSAMASFENLVALANYEEHLREARKIVWRDRGELPVEIRDLTECLKHAGKGGLRSGALAFAIRAGVNLILLMTRIKRIPRNYRFALIRHAVFGLDSFRFAAMLGSFVTIYKFILNALPILPQPPTRRASSLGRRSRSLLRSAPPPDSPFTDASDEDDDIEMARPEVRRGSRHARLSISAQAHQTWARKRTRRWYAVLAGTVAGGVSILFERRERRVGIAQQMFVSTVQVYPKTESCGQIMYAWFLRPETLPRSYDHWIATASRVHPETLAIQRDLIVHGKFNVRDMEALLAKETTPANRSDMLARIALATAQPPSQSFGPPFVPCSALHPWLDSCPQVQIDRFFKVVRWMLPIYGALHVIPMLLFRRNRVWKEPGKMFLRAGFGTARSSAFLGVFVFIYQSFFCLNHNMYNDLTALRAVPSPTLLARLAKILPQPLVDALVGRKSYYAMGILAGLSLFVEDKRRREELAMYVLPKGMESAWLTARGRGWVGKTGQWGEVLLTAVSMGMVMDVCDVTKLGLCIHVNISATPDF